MSRPFLAIGDTHYKFGNKHQTDKLEQIIFTTIQTHSPRFIIFLGDILHDFGKVNTRVKSRVINFFTQLGKILPVYAIIGNHDFINNRQFLEEEHAFQGVNIPGCRFIDKPSWIEEKYLVIPYVPPGRFTEALQEGITSKNDNIPSGSKPTRPEIIFAHQEFHGSGYSDKGDHWDGGIPVISGHIHRPQTLPNNILYPGAAIQTNFGETWDTSIICVIETPEFKSSLLLDDLKIDYVSTNTTGKHLTFYLEASDVLVDGLPKVEKNYNIRLNITGDRRQLDKIKRSRKLNLSKFDKINYITKKHTRTFSKTYTTLGDVDIAIEEIKKSGLEWTSKHDKVFEEFRSQE